MIIGKDTDSYSIGVYARDYSYDFTIAQIKTDCQSRGRNCGFLMKGLFQGDDTGYTIVYATMTLQNNNIYLYQSDNWGSAQDNSNKSGMLSTGLSTASYGYFAKDDGGSAIQPYTGAYHDWLSYTYNNKNYKGFGINNTKAAAGDTVFFTTLDYDKIFINDVEVITPVWRAAEGVEGIKGIFSFSKIAEAYINNGEPVRGASDSNIERFSTQTELGVLMANTGINAPIRPIYAGSVDYLELELVSPPSPLPISIGHLVISVVEAGVTIWTGTVTAVSGSIPKTYLSFLIDDEHQIAKPSLLYVVGSNPLSIDYNIDGGSMSQQDMHRMYLWLTSHATPPEVTEDDEEEGDNPWNDEDIDGLIVPNIDAIATGFTTLYQVDKSDLQDLSDFLWSDNFVDNVTKFFEDPKDIIVGLTIMPFAPDVGSSETIQAGGISTGVSGKPLTHQYKIYDFGEVYIQKAKGNFLDYAGYTKITAHLPFVGSHTLDTDDVVGKTLSLSYILDFMTGSCVACIKVNGSAHYFFGGACGIQVPTSSEDFSRLYSSVLSAGASIGTALATMASGGLTAPMAIGAAASVCANTMMMAPDVAFTSGSGSINGMLSSQSAYITVEVPNEKLAANQANYIGRLAMITKKIGDLTGFIKCYKAHLDGVTATLDERNEIMSFLMNGFRRESGSSLPDLTPTVTGNSVILFLKCTSEDDVMGKTWDETTLKIEGKLIYNQSFLTPEFQIKGDVSAYNYAYIPLFGRYYYIKNIVAQENGIETISFKVDPLQSFKSEIDNCYAIIERQTNLVSSKMNDPQYFTLQNRSLYTVHFKDPVTRKKIKFDRDNNCYILTIAGS